MRRPPCVQALYDAADDDSATGGPDLTRRIFPVVDGGDRRTATARLPEAEVGEIADRVVDGPDAAPRRPRRPAHADDERTPTACQMPFYVSPEQLMKDRADFARKGIARGRSVVVVQLRRRHPASSPRTPPGRCTRSARSTTASPSPRSASYNEFENLRIAGVRLADLRGYSYDRRDVTGRGLANAYAQTLGTIFSSGGEKPYEVEIVVAEVGDTPDDDQIYRLTYDGSVADEQGFAVMGGSAETVSNYLTRALPRGLRSSRRWSWRCRRSGTTGAASAVTGDQLEVAVLDRTRTQPRKFRRLGRRLTDLFDASTCRRRRRAEPVTGPEPGHRPERHPRRRCGRTPLSRADVAVSADSCGLRRGTA